MQYPATLSTTRFGGYIKNIPFLCSALFLLCGKAQLAKRSIASNFAEVNLKKERARLISNF